MIKYISELKKSDLEGKKVLLRVDFNTSVDGDGKIEEFKIKANLETIDYLINSGASVVMLSHVDPPLDSFSSIIDQITKTLGHEFKFVSLPDFLSGTWNLEPGNLSLIDNIRQDSREVQNDEGFAQELSKGFDFYVNDAFASMHRNHASVVGIAKFLPAYAGLLVRKETENLKQAIDAPREGKVLVMGGAKISTKLPVIKNFLNKAEKILIGGALANNFFQKQGINVGASLVDDSISPEVESDNIILPTDIIVSRDKTGKSEVTTSPVKNLEPDELILDIGPETRSRFIEIIKNAQTVIWNGPLGFSEIQAFAEGTEIVASAVVSAKYSIVGGGDTIAVLDKLNMLDKISFVSTGGGAMLDFLASQHLPGLEVLGYHD